MDTGQCSLMESAIRNSTKGCTYGTVGQLEFNNSRRFMMDMSRHNSLTTKYATIFSFNCSFSVVGLMLTRS